MRKIEIKLEKKNKDPRVINDNRKSADSVSPGLMVIGVEDSKNLPIRIFLPLLWAPSGRQEVGSEEDEIVKIVARKLSDLFIITSRWKNNNFHEQERKAEKNIDCSCRARSSRFAGAVQNWPELNPNHTIIIYFRSLPRITRSNDHFFSLSIREAFIPEISNPEEKSKDPFPPFSSSSSSSSSSSLFLLVPVPSDASWDGEGIRVPFFA